MELLLLILGIGVVASFVGGGDGSDGGGGFASEEPDTTAEGTAGPDGLVGTPFDDVILARAGNDTINGDIGNDYLDGNAGDDEVYGEVGEDTVLGGAGNDLLGGGTGGDFLRGGDGDDTLRGGADDDLLEGASNADFMEGDGGNDTLRGGPGKDYMTGNLGMDSMEGGPGNDTMVGLVGDFNSAPTSDTDDGDIIEGWQGADFIVMGAGDDAWGEFATTNADGAGDTFVSGLWASGNPPTIHDYDGVEDALVLYYDPAVVAAPTVTVAAVAGPGGTIWNVGLDGDVLMRVDVGTSGITILQTDIMLMTPV